MLSLSLSHLYSIGVGPPPAAPPRLPARRRRLLRAHGRPRRRGPLRRLERPGREPVDRLRLRGSPGGAGERWARRIWAKGEGGKIPNVQKPTFDFFGSKKKKSRFYYTFFVSFNLFHLFSGIHLRTYTQTRPLPTLSNDLLDYKHMRVSPVDLLPFP